MTKVCQECCQVNSPCKCEGGLTTMKKFGLVKGCLNYDNNIRCKKEVPVNVYVCKEHTCVDTEYTTLLNKH
jgi:hypothetical protein